MNEKYYCGLDIGSYKTKACLLKFKDQGSEELVGIYETETQGFKNASVTDLVELSESVHLAINGLSRKTGIRLKQIQLGINGGLVEIRQVSTEIPLADRGHKVITLRDLNKVNHQARLLGVKMEEEILHDLPQFYQVDDVNSALNPVGLYGRKLGVKSLLVVVRVNMLRNMVKAVNNAGYDVENTFWGSYAASDIVLTEEEKKQGCILIDIGAGVSSILVFKDKVLKDMIRISLGGDLLTHKIAQSVQLSFQLADEIKRSYAVVFDHSKFNEEEILVKRENAYIPIKRELVCQSIEPEVGQLVELIHEKIFSCGLYEQMHHNIVIIGGGALLSGLIERISQKTNCSANLGQFRAVTQKSWGNTALYATVVGLAFNGYVRGRDRLFSSSRKTHWVKKALDRVVDIYQEYF